MLKVAGGVGGGGNASGTVTQVNTGTGLTGGPITTSGTIRIANTTVAAASYGSANTVGTFTVNQQGQLTAAGNVAIDIAVANVAGAVPNTVNVLAAGLLTGGGALTGNVTLTLNDVPVANVTGAVSNTTTITAGTGLTGGGNLASNVTISLANTTANAGTYGSATQVAQIAVDAQGRITAVANVTISGGGGGGNVSANTAYAYAWFIS